MEWLSKLTLLFMNKLLIGEQHLHNYYNIKVMGFCIVTYLKYEVGT